MILGLLFLLAVIVGAIAITAGGIALIRRNRDRIRGSGGLGSAMQELESLFVESKKHMIEAERHKDGDAEESGDPPEK
ncbi:MAG: hypothetical protein DMF58_12920 [Acidobacteria bacterium]|nr:MAG: hypothetical protein DMF58_12920 [Acidobacteriota bacterium]HKO00071.1 hypothetical protein [Thermoanaerobaculia bacterium]